MLNAGATSWSGAFRRSISRASIVDVSFRQLPLGGERWHAEGARAMGAQQMPHAIKSRCVPIIMMPAHMQNIRRDHKIRRRLSMRITGAA